MHVRFQALLLLSLAAAPLLAQGNERRERRDRRGADAAPVALENFTFREGSFDSAAVGKQMKYGVYLPKGYDDVANKDKRWPLAIWLHGMFEDHMRFHTRGGAPVLDKTVGAGKLPPCVFVTANGGATSMYVNRKDARWEDLITADLLAHLEKEYRVSTRREERAILGVSMGGMAALRIAFTKPELFGVVGAHSAAVFPEDPAALPERLKSRASQFGLDEVFGNPIEKEPWQKANPLCLAQAAEAKRLASLRIYFDAGTEDRYGFATGNEALHEALEAKKIEHTWRLIQGGGHSWGAGFQDQTLPYSFATVGEVWQAAAARGAGLRALGDDKGAGAGDAGTGDGGGKGKKAAPAGAGGER